MESKNQYTSSRSGLVPTFFGQCLSYGLFIAVGLSLNACAPQFKASILDVANLVQDAELFGETPEAQDAPESADHPQAPNDSDTLLPETDGTLPSLPPISTAPQDKPPVVIPNLPPQEPVDTTTDATPEVTPSNTSTSSSNPPLLEEQKLETSQSEEDAETALETVTEEVIAVTPTETNQGAYFFLNKKFNTESVEVDDQNVATAITEENEVRLAIEMTNFIQSTKENGQVEASVSADLGLDRLVELKTQFSRNAPRRTFKRGRWHVQAECQFHATENRCTFVSYLVHVRFSFDRKSNPPQPQVHMDQALAFYASENKEGVYHFRVLPSSFRDFTKLVTEMKAHDMNEE